MRAFDLRVADRGEDFNIEERFIFVHGAHDSKTPLIDGIDMVRKFLDSHPNEIIVLDFHSLPGRNNKFTDTELLLNLLLALFDSPDGKSYLIPEAFHSKTLA